MPQITLKLNRDLGGKKKGALVVLETDDEGTILEGFWRRRLADAPIDKCVEVVKEKLDTDAEPKQKDAKK